MATNISTATYEGIFTRGPQAAVNATAVDDGKIRVATDSKRLFFDFGSSRIEISDLVWDYTHNQLTTNTGITNPQVSKLYLASDTRHAFVYNDTISSFVDITNFTVDNAVHASTADYTTNASTAVYAQSATNATSASYSSNAANASTATYDSTGNQINTKYAPLASPVFTGSPAAPTQSTTDNSTKIATTAFVKNAIDAAFENITTINFSIVETLPNTGVNGTIYLISNSGSGTNIYDEYVWVNNAWEKLGTAEVNLTNYVNTVSESGSGNAYTGYTKNGNTVTLTKGSTFLTQHPSITQGSNTTSSITPTFNSTFTVIDSITKDANGHVTAYNTKNVKLPNYDISGMDFDFGDEDE